MNNEEYPDFKSAENIPESPQMMPPPYWRSSGVIFQIILALKELLLALRELKDAHPAIEGLAWHHQVENSATQDDEDDDLYEIFEPLLDIEHIIKTKCDLIIFMAAIESEDLINMTLVYNTDKEISESIERLGPAEKFLVLSSCLGGKKIKSNHAYEAIRKLATWRNAYAHGHCTDRPTKTLRHNHLVRPDYYPTVPKQIEAAVDYLNKYLLVSKHLKDISINQYTSMIRCEDDEIEYFINEIKKYNFSYEGAGESYTVSYSNHVTDCS